MVARWYPSHDDPVRGSFVGDLVEALDGEDCEVRVASWEHAFYGRTTPRDWLVRARDAWRTAVRIPAATNVPRSWGSGVPVARLPALHTADESVVERIEHHAATLTAFGSALHSRWPFDVIHAHTGLPDGAAAIRLAREVDVPVVVTEHDRSLRTTLRESAEVRDAYLRLVDQADLVVAVSEQFRDLLCRALRLSSCRIDVLPNPIPATFFTRPLNQGRDPDELLYVGARKESKGIVTLLQAFAEVHARHRGLRLRLVGRSEKDSDEARWHELAEELGIAAAVRFDPPADRAGVANAMSRAALFVHPSPFESFGMVAAEAMASGLPIAGTRSGIEELLGEDGRFGALAAGTAADALGEAIERAVIALNRFDAAAMREAVGRFAASRVARDTVERYREVIERRPGRPEPTALEPPSSSGGMAGQVTSHGGEGSAAIPAAGAVVVGLQRQSAVRRMQALPPEVLGSTTFVTSGGSDPDPLPVRTTIVIDADAEYRRRLAGLGQVAGARWGPIDRLLHFVRSPRRAVARRRLRTRREAAVATITGQLVARAWSAARPAVGSEYITPIDVADLVASDLALAAGAQLAPGTLRWLADRSDALPAGDEMDA
jgi:glycosyltransferase involved in cell wall biosynthesis